MISIYYLFQILFLVLLRRTKVSLLLAIRSILFNALHMYSLLSKALCFKTLAFGFCFYFHFCWASILLYTYSKAILSPLVFLFSSFSSSLFYLKSRDIFLSGFSLSRTNFNWSNSVLISSNFTSNCLSSSFNLSATYDSLLSIFSSIKFGSIQTFPDLSVPYGHTFFSKVVCDTPCVGYTTPFTIKYRKPGQVWRTRVYRFMVLNFIKKRLVFNIMFSYRLHDVMMAFFF